MEWTFGITDSRPQKWKKREPRWEDETVTASDQHNYHQLINKLCETALAKRREDGEDHQINAHLWNLQICSEKALLLPGKPLDPIERVMQQYAGDSDSSDDEDEDNYRGKVMVMPKKDIQRHRQIVVGEEYQYVASDSKISKQMLPVGHIIQVTYDFGDTTTLYLKVLSVRHRAVSSLLQYFEAESNVAGQLKDMQVIPAYTWPKEQQIDAFFPNYSKAFLGHYIPLLQPRNNNNTNSNLIGSASLGLTAKMRSEKDTIFATIEDAGCSQDLMFAGVPFEDLNEFLAVAELSWTPRDRNNDPDKLHRYRYNGVARYLFPKGPQADEPYEVVKDIAENDPWAAYCAKKLFYRLENTNTNDGDVGEEDTEQAGSREFDFAKAFPKTAEQLSSGKFRWFQYKKGVLRVIVGRGVGDENRDFESGQVLRTWKQPFSTFHELLCAVEASWVYYGKPLTLDTELSYFDSDLGPSNPGPKEPTCYGKAKDAAAICSKSDRKKLVTAMAIVEEADGQQFLYSGHDDGTLTKWNLQDNTIVWSRKIYPGASDDFPTDNVSYGIKATAGVAGIVARWDDTRDWHRIYTWTNIYEGYPTFDFDDRGPSKVKCWCGNDGTFFQEYVCDVEEDEDGDPANPTIATVVFCRLLVNRRWELSMLVGLHCICDAVLNWNKNYDRFDLEQASEIGEGSILPFYEFTNGQAMETWRGHQGIVQAMAVVPDKYLLSYSMRPGHGLADAMILWDLTNPGVPLCRHEFWNPRRSLFKQNQTRISGVAGISVSGTDVLLCCEYGDRIAVVTVEDEDGDPCLELHGYGNIGNRHPEQDGGFHGRMAMCGDYAVMANEGHTDTWLFEIEGNADHEKLDRREGNARDFRGCDEEDVDEGGTNPTFSGREIAAGKVTFPKFGGEAPKRKKQKSIFGSSMDTYDEVQDDNMYGEGGPTAVAIHGKWLVAGFANGTLVRSSFLPEPFDDQTGATKDSNTMASFSPLPSDEWHHPVLASTADDE